MRFATDASDPLIVDWVALNIISGCGPGAPVLKMDSSPMSELGKDPLVWLTCTPVNAMEAVDEAPLIIGPLVAIRLDKATMERSLDAYSAEISLRMRGVDGLNDVKLVLVMRNK